MKRQDPGGHPHQVKNARRYENDFCSRPALSSECRCQNADSKSRRLAKSEILARELPGKTKSKPARRCSARIESWQQKNRRKITTPNQSSSGCRREAALESAHIRRADEPKGMAEPTTQTQHRPANVSSPANRGVVELAVQRQQRCAEEKKRSPAQKEKRRSEIPLPRWPRITTIQKNGSKVPPSATISRRYR